MKVKELIEHLQNFDPEMPVVLDGSHKHSVASDCVSIRSKYTCVIEAKPVYDQPELVGGQVYDTLARPTDKKIKVLKLQPSFKY